ncbi:hydroxyethylthiazole kinase, partial [Craterilacuibacter sp.]|uniref:hydroxyethylthiazole kinase n=1 Tax=Craterilacuibacter sp. TaxID=2870909 RepID=UPI003F35B405
VNVGTLDAAQRDAMLVAVASANTAGTPWVLDPVAAGVLPFRTAFCRELLRCRPAVIRGNASEIRALAGEAGQGRGVDSLDASEAALDAAQRLSRDSGALVIVTGATDYLCDGEAMLAVSGGHARLQQVTGTGCSLSALVAAACALAGERLPALAAVCALMKLAGERAAAASVGPGSFAVALLDEIAAIDGAALQARWPA